MITLALADRAALAWAQQAVTAHHYLHAPVDARCSVVGYVALREGERVGCLLFGRPEATRCYQGELTYGGQADVTSGKARFDRWELINLARVWLDPRVQSGGAWHVPNLATQLISQALKRVVLDYLAQYPPCFLDEPWKFKVCLSYCDTKLHQGTIYRAAGFQLARTNADGIQTWYRALRSLQGHERQQIERLAGQSQRSRVYRSQRASVVIQERFL